MRTGENIYKRKDGYWEGRIKNGYYANGKTKYKSVYATTYSECKSKLDKEKQAKVIPLSKRKIKVCDLYVLYINHIRGSVKDSTLSTYENLYKNHIGKSLGKIYVSRLDKDMIDKFLLDKSETYAKSYVFSIKILLFSMLNYAFHDNIIAEPIRNTVKVKVINNQIVTFSEEEQSKIENYAISHPDFDTFGVLLVLYTGMRIGELCALKIYDFDFKDGFLKINKTMERIKNLEKDAPTRTKIVVEAPKSEKSIRDIPIPYSLVETLRARYKQYNKNAYFLTGSIDKFIEPRTMENRFKRILENCKVNYKNFHVLRHTFATNCLTNNIYDIKTLSEILGHEDSKTTLKLYVHSNRQIKARQVEELDRIFIRRIKNGVKAI